MFALSEEGWRQLTLRWGLFFLFLAGLNEVVWRTQDYEFWVKFKVFGIMPITVLFALAQTPLLMKHEQSSRGVGGLPRLGHLARRPDARQHARENSPASGCRRSCRG